MYLFNIRMMTDLYVEAHAATIMLAREMRSAIMIRLRVARFNTDRVDIDNAFSIQYQSSTCHSICTACQIQCLSTYQIYSSFQWMKSNH